LAFTPNIIAETPLLAFSGVLLIWQVVGGWRLASRIMRDTGDFAVSAAIYAGITLAFILALVQAIDQISENYLLPVDLSGHVPELLEIRDDGRVIVLNGAISYDVNTSLKVTIQKFPNATTVSLESEGGSIFAGPALALTIAEHALATQVDGQCSSACTLVFMAGAPRILGPNGQLGFHGYAFDDALWVRLLDVNEQEAVDRAFFTRRGISREFIDRVFATPSSEIWQPDRAELIAGGVIAN
jgi:hypothetical protein